MQWGGAAYVFWLAIKFASAGAMSDQQAAWPQASMMSGAFLLMLSPKAWVILTLLFTQFPGGSLLGVVLIALVFTLNNLAAFVIWALAGQAMAGLFRSAASARLLNMIFAAALASVAVWMLVA